MVTTANRKLRILESRRKICPPAKLDDELCFYSPQENVEALKHPRVRRWIEFVSKEYKPKVDKIVRTIHPRLPSTKTNPYMLSPEHLHIIAALLAAGFGPMKGETLATDFSESLP